VSENVVEIRRVFLAHPKSMTDEAVQEYSEKVRKLKHGQTLKSGATVAASLTTGRDSIEEFKKRPGADARAALNWGAWTEWVVGGLKGAFDAEPRYHYIVVVPMLYVGRATAGLVSRATQKTWPKVLLFDGEKLQKVTGVAVLDPRNMQQGWALRLG